ncbi:MAG: hypothetical protein K6G88_07100 [Lachnospiraceae bacterium]|nr:hypothetical protein [Lachnospiraceae bacterium]
MKKMYCILLVGCLAFSTLTGCGNTSTVDKLIEEKKVENNTGDNKKSDKDDTDDKTSTDNKSNEDGNSDTDDKTGTDNTMDGQQDAGLSEEGDSENNDGKLSEDEMNDSNNSEMIDLTKLSSSMVYGQVYDMMGSPDKYLGKKVRMEGTFSIFEGTKKNYYACVVADATACCQQGIEFELAGDYKYPDDYPELGEDITVVGIFNTYVEDGANYFFLDKAKFE